MKSASPSSSAIHRCAGVTERQHRRRQPKTVRDENGEIISGLGTYQDVHRACHRWLMKNDSIYRRNHLAAQAERKARAQRKAAAAASSTRRFAGF